MGLEKNSLSDNSLIDSRNTRDFCIFILYLRFYEINFLVQILLGIVFRILKIQCIILSINTEILKFSFLILNF